MAAGPAGAPPPGPGRDPALPRDVGVVLAAAGAGARFGARKALVELAGRPLFLHSLSAFASLCEVREVVVVAPAGDLSQVREWVERWAGGAAVAGAGEPMAAGTTAAELAAAGGAPASAGHTGRPPVAVVPGGERRQDSVERGISTLSTEAAWVLVHDAARPLVTRADIERLLAAVRESGAAVLGHPATDSVKEEREGFILRDLPRAQVWLVQTPQGASRQLLERAYRESGRAGREFTDEASLLSAIGVPVRLVPGKWTNLKVTFPEDLALAEKLVKLTVNS